MIYESQCHRKLVCHGMWWLGLYMRKQKLLAIIQNYRNNEKNWLRMVELRTYHKLIKFKMAAKQPFYNCFLPKVSHTQNVRVGLWMNEWINVVLCHLCAQENLLRMVRGHCPTDTWFEIRVLAPPQYWIVTRERRIRILLLLNFIARVGDETAISDFASRQP